MPQWTKAPQSPRSIAVCLFPSFSNYCLANAIEPLRAANRLGGAEAFSWRLYSHDGAAVRTSSGIEVAVAGAFDDAVPADFVFLISSYGHRDADTPGTRRMLRQSLARGATLVGMDTGAWLMAGAGLLAGRHATIHWDLRDEFAERFLDVSVIAAPFVRDGKMMTCGGALATLDLSLSLVGDMFGQGTAMDVAALLTGTPDRGMGPKAPGLAGRMVALMTAHLEQPLALAALARRLGTAPKQLARRSARDLGAAPGTVYRHLRLAAARRLLDRSDLTVAEIAARCGYRDASAMTRAFRRRYGRTPRAVRAEAFG